MHFWWQGEADSVKMDPRGLGEVCFGETVHCVCVCTCVCACLGWWNVAARGAPAEVCLEDGVKFASFCCLFWVGCDGLLNSVGEPLTDLVEVSGKDITTLLCLAAGSCLRSSLRRAAGLGSSCISCYGEASELHKHLQCCSTQGGGSCEYNQFQCVWGWILGNIKCRPNPCTGAASVTGTKCRDRQQAAETSISPGAACQSTVESRAWILMSSEKKKSAAIVVLAGEQLKPWSMKPSCCSNYSFQKGSSFDRFGFEA